MSIDIAQQKTQIINLLRQTGREGMEQVINYLESAGFFEAPASVNRHLNVPGGLACHSLNVYRIAKRIVQQMTEEKPEIANLIKEENIVIAALLHDTCKSNIYRTVKKFRKDANNRWEEYEAYEADASRFPAGHGEKSVIMLLQLGLKLHKEEVLAIRWHMGPWSLALHSFDDKANYGAANDGFPLVSIMQAADSLATHILEV